jgi:hypothetical protein
MLLSVAALACAAPLPFFPATTVLARGGPPAGAASCDDYGAVLVCYAESRAACQQRVAIEARTAGPGQVVVKHCEELFDGRWIFLIWN